MRFRRPRSPITCPTISFSSDPPPRPLPSPLHPSALTLTSDYEISSVYVCAPDFILRTLYFDGFAGGTFPKLRIIRRQKSAIIGAIMYIMQLSVHFLGYTMDWSDTLWKCVNNIFAYKRDDRMCDLRD